MPEYTIDWVTDNAEVWSKALEPFKGVEHVWGIEIGSYEGRASVWFLTEILTHPTARLTCIDPFVSPLFYESVQPFADRVTLVVGQSQVMLRDSALVPEQASFVYIDGSHSASEVIEDIVLSFPLLKIGGILILDDYLLDETAAMPFLPGPGLAPVRTPKPAIDAFLRIYSDQIRIISLGYQVAVEKIGRL